MRVLTNSSSQGLWQDVIKNAEKRCEVSLRAELEAYLVSLLIRYTNRPDVLKQILATAFLESLQLREKERALSLQYVGDQCLLFAGLFPHIAEKRLIRVGYFVDLGRTAYTTISHTANDLYGSLALEFVVLMDVLQSIREPSDLMPIEAYELWNEVGSKRALKFLQAYSKAIPFKQNTQ